MMKNPSKMIFLFSMILGTMITISSNSWLGVWMGMEINLLSFIPLMIDSKNLMTTEASLKYFLTQALASSILLLSMMMFLMMNNFSYNLISSNITLLISMPLMMKSGVAPFHFWFPNVMEGMTWTSSLMLMTWQKIAPMAVISYLTSFNFLIMFIIASAIMGSLGGLNQTSLRKILAYSSINHLGWMLSAMMFNEYTWTMYFFIYTLMSISLVVLFNQFNLFYINQIFSMFTHSFILKFSFLISFLSLAGLPPFLGFLPKWIVIQSLASINHFNLILILIFMSLITMYFYLRICYSALMLSYTEPSWNYMMKFKKNYFFMNMTFLFISLNSLFVVTSLIFYLM